MFKQKNSENVLTRRVFLAGATGLGVAGVLGNKIGNNIDEQKSNTILADTVLENNQTPAHPENIEKYDEMSHSLYFMTDANRYKDEYKNEIEIVGEKIDELTLIQTYFKLPDISLVSLRNNLEALAPALAFVESRYRDVKSEVGAFGVMQIMPNTWDELAKEGEDKTKLADQIKVSARLVEQAYKHISSVCKTELDLIKQNFFAGDEVAFETAFLSPLLINSYNAGMGSLEKLVKEFTKLCKEPKDTVELFEQSEVLTGYDVFIGMAHTGNQRGWASWYKDVASEYTCKTYGAHMALSDYFKS